MNYRFMFDDIMRVEQEELYIKYKEEVLRVRLLIFGFLVIFLITQTFMPSSRATLNHG